MNLKTHPKTAAAVLVILLLGAIGIGLGLRTLSKSWAQVKSGSSTPGPSAASPSQPSSTAATSSPVIKMLMAQYGLDLEAATYLAAAKTQVVSQSKTSVQLLFTFPDGATADETITIQPDQQYMPTPEELARAAQSGKQTYNLKFAAVPDGPDRTQITLQYFVPYSSLPPDAQQAIHQQATSADWFQLVPSAWAQGPGGAGAGMGVKAGFGVGKQVFGTLMNIRNAMKKSEQNYDWMNQLDTLENCAKNPTNPVTQRAYEENPVYRDQTVAGIEQARSVVQQVTAVRFLAQENAVAAGLIGGPFGIILGGLTYLNDMTLKDVANRQISDIAKSVTECEPSPPPKPGQGDGTLVYHMHREGYLDYNEETRLVQGAFTLQPGPVDGSFTLAGKGEFQGSMQSSRFGTSSQCKGESEISGGGMSASFLISSSPVTGGCQFIERGKVTQLGPNDSDTGFVCEFQNVDLVNGGSYEVHANGEESQWATCRLELTPRQE
jgi:hypothetical protein